ncbi:NAD-dependent epimerase/dehydratase family protein [Phycicoccus avicenniae]|uniref:NAD-dependent epimerase/dehydratase family protein n=1 Tax=Phycicoccus avicenniae TaxID=2828860 RepID=UPI003D268E56
MQVVLGQGPVGVEVARQLVARDEEVVVLTRAGRTSVPGAAAVAVDATDAADLTAACSGATVVHACASPPYHLWDRDFPALAASVLHAAESVGAVLVLAGNLYGYGPGPRVLDESLPLVAAGPKGRTRGDIWRRALAAHEAGRVRATEIRASDFFGPGVTTQGHLAGRAVPRVLAGRPVPVIGDPDALHTWTYVPDFAAAMVRAGEDERAWGRPWHVPSGPPHSLRQMLDAMADAAGVPAVPVRRTPWPVLRVLSVGVPALRGLEEVRYQLDEDFVMDSSAFTGTFGSHATSLRRALHETVEWWRSRADAG